jgi:hypothetical protein
MDMQDHLRFVEGMAPRRIGGIRRERPGGATGGVRQVLECRRAGKQAQVPLARRDCFQVA